MSYYTQTNQIECVDWVSAPIKEFCGNLTPQKWALIKRYCILADKFAFTKIYIWGGALAKHLAYNEPIHNYIANPSLLKTGQGYHYGSGKKIKQTHLANIEPLLPPKICSCCKQTINS